MEEEKKKPLYAQEPQNHTCNYSSSSTATAQSLLVRAIVSYQKQRTMPELEIRRRSSSNEEKAVIQSQCHPILFLLSYLTLHYLGWAVIYALFYTNLQRLKNMMMVEEGVEAFTR